MARTPQTPTNGQYTDEQLITVLAAQAHRLSQTGPKKSEDLCHRVINDLLDERDRH